MRPGARRCASGRAGRPAPHRRAPAGAPFRLRRGQRPATGQKGPQGRRAGPPLRHSAGAEGGASGGRSPRAARWPTGAAFQRWPSGKHLPENEVARGIHTFRRAAGKGLGGRRCFVGRLPDAPAPLLRPRAVRRPRGPRPRVLPPPWPPPLPARRPRDARRPPSSPRPAPRPPPLPLCGYPVTPVPAFHTLLFAILCVVKFTAVCRVG